MSSVFPGARKQIPSRGGPSSRMAAHSPLQANTALGLPTCSTRAALNLLSRDLWHSLPWAGAMLSGRLHAHEFG